MTRKNIKKYLNIALLIIVFVFIVSLIRACSHDLQEIAKEVEEEKQFKLDTQKYIEENYLDKDYHVIQIYDNDNYVYNSEADKRIRRRLVSLDPRAYPDTASCMDENIVFLNSSGKEDEFLYSKYALCKYRLSRIRH